MEKPIVRIIQQEEITTSQREVTQDEMNALLVKYGYKPKPIELPKIDITIGLTLDEMLAIEDKKLKAEKHNAELKRQEELNRPHAITFDDRTVKYYNTEHKTLDNGFGFNIQIVSDMKF